MRLQITGRLVAFLFEGNTHLVEQLGHVVELGKRTQLEFVQLRSGHAGGADIGGLFALLVLLLAAGGREVLGGRIHQAVDDFVDRHIAGADLLRVGKYFGDRRRAGRNGHHHVLQAVFNALGDLDLAFARQQLDRTHFAHVHADRIGGAAEFGVDRGQRSLGLFLNIVVRGRGRNVLVHQQRLGIRRLVEDLDAHVAEGTDDGVDRLGVDQVVRQVIVDLGVGQEAAVLAELDQGLELVAAGLEVLFGAVITALEGFLERLFLGATVLGAQLARAHLFNDLHARISGIVTRIRHRVGAAVHQLFFGLLGFASGLAAFNSYRGHLGGCRLEPSTGFWRHFGHQATGRPGSHLDRNRRLCVGLCNLLGCRLERQFHQRFGHGFRSLGLALGSCLAVHHV